MRGLGPYPRPFLSENNPGHADLFLAREADGSGYYPAVDRDGR